MAFFPRPVRIALLATPMALLAACRAAPSGGPAITKSAEPGAPPAPSAAPTVPPLSAGARTEDERNTIAVFRDAAASTVFVTQTRVVVDYWAGVAQEVPAGSGSGFVWDEQGHVITNFHVVENARSLTVTFQDQQTFDAELVGVEPRKDVAVLRVKAPVALLKPVRAAKGAPGSDSRCR